MSKAKNKSPSLLAFMLLPQFGLCLRGFSHIGPIFIRTLALMFEQAGLISMNHPATQYGAAGVRKTGFYALMGEAWFTLRTTRASPYQWSMFASVVLLIVMIAASAVTAVMTVGFGVGSQAYAQLFSIPAGATDAGSIPPWGGGGMFDTKVTVAGDAGHFDYGIMVLDKVIRQGMAGAPTGSPLQSGMQALFEVYNSGVLVVAGVMLFWIILSVVVDTAKTGVVGGGRHNMVWAPIRIVFALGLLIPLGDVGFSSGQFMVTKLAEWGSNLGTNAWRAYIGSVAANSFIANLVTANPTDLVRSYSDIWLCTVTYNSYQYQSTGSLPADQTVKRQIAEGTGAQSTWHIYFTNETTGNLCGNVTFPFYNGDPGIQAAVANAAEDPVGAGIANFKMRMIDAYSRLFYRGNLLGGADKGQLDDKAREWACEFAAQHILPTGGGPSPLTESGMCANTGGSPTDIFRSPNLDAPAFPDGTAADGCGGKVPAPPAAGAYPDDRCILDMIKNFTTVVRDAMNTNKGALEGVFQAQMADLDSKLLGRGWADMGRWFLVIGQMNDAVKSMATTPVTITPGDYVKPGLATRASAGMSEATGGLLGSDLDAKMVEVSEKADSWWKHEAVVANQRGINVMPVNSGTLPDGATQVFQSSNEDFSPSALDIATSVAGLLLSPATAPMAILNLILSAIPVNAPSFMLSIIQPDDPDIYPFAHVIAIGGMIFATGLALVTIPAIITVALAITQVGGMPAIALVSGPIGSLMTTLGTTMIMAGGVLKFYLPVLPFLRVAFAVLTWMISVFEAVVMVPIAALSHLTTEGDGLAGHAKAAWILWLNVLLRPVLVVMGFVGAIMVFNTFVVYFHDALKNTVTVAFATGLGFEGIISGIAMTILYVATIYVVANSSFKLLDMIPNALMRWMPGASPDHSMDEHGTVGMMMSNYAGNVMGRMAGSMNMGDVGKQIYEAKNKKGPGAVGGGETPKGG